MQVVIPIAGKAKRMQGAYQGPKQLIPVHGRPLIEYVLDELPDSINEIVLIVGGLHEEKVREYFGCEKFGRTIKYAQQDEQLGLAHAIFQAKDIIKEKFLVLLPDDIFDPVDIEKLVGEPNLAILTKEVENPESFGVAVTDDQGFITDLVEKPEQFISNKALTGAALFDEDFFNIVTQKSERGEYDWTDVMLGLIKEKGRKIKTIPASFWLPINNPEQLTEAQDTLLSKLDQKDALTIS